MLKRIRRNTKSNGRSKDRNSNQGRSKSRWSKSRFTKKRLGVGAITSKRIVKHYKEQKGLQMNPKCS